MMASEVPTLENNINQKIKRSLINFRERFFITHLAIEI